MNSLKTNILGGFPWVLDDFRWHHDQTREALTAIILGLNIDGGNCRLQGVVGTLNSPNWDISAGYLLINGEIVRVDAQTVADIDLGFDYYHVTVSETLDPLGTKSFEDGGTGDAYIKRRGIINANGFNPVGADLKITLSPNGLGDSFPTLTSVIANTNTDFTSEWSSIPAATLDALAHNQIDNVVSGSIRYKKVGKVMFTEWNLILDFTGATSVFELTVPAQLTPAMNQQAYGIAVLGNSGGLYNKWVSVTHSISNIFSFSVNNNEYTVSGSTAALQFSTSYRVA